MRKHLKHILCSGFILAAILMLFCVSVSAFDYTGSVNDVNLSTYTIDIGGTVLPLAEFPAGSHSPYDNTETAYMTVEQAAQYGISLSSDLWLRGSECVGFARYVYAALYYKYPADATMDNYLAYQINGNSIYYEDVITSVIPGGSYTASDAAKLIKSCYPGSVIRMGGHSMVIMSIFNDGLIIYDANFSYTDYNVVDVRKYTWESFVEKLGSRDIAALQIPAYYPGYTDSLGRSFNGVYEYDIDTSTAGVYEVYNVSSKLNIRSAPSTSSSIVGELYPGDTVEVLGSYYGSDKEWAAINHNGAGCWVAMEYLKLLYKNETEDGFTLDTSDAGTYEVYNCASLGYVRVRSGPGTSYDQVGTLAYGSIVTVYGSYNGWAVVDYNGSREWVSMDYLTPYVQKITITFDPNGGTVSSTTMTVNAGSAIGEMPTGTKTDRTLIGWFNGNTQYTSSSIAPSSDLTLKAKWGIYSFVDVEETQWYADPVMFVYDHNVMNGVSETLFRPDSELTRAMMVQILYNLAGKPAVSAGTSTFTDVSSSDWYYAAVEWAAMNGLTNGYSDGTFKPSGSITRQDMVTMIWRYANNYLGLDTFNRADLSQFSDGDTVSDYAKAAVEWAVAEGLVNGTGNGMLKPLATATRAQIAKIMMVFLGGA